MADGTGGETCDSPIDSQGPRVKNDWQFFGECQCPDRLAVARPHFIGEHPQRWVGLINIRTSNENLDSDQISRIEVDGGDRKGDVGSHGREKRGKEGGERQRIDEERLRRRCEGRRSAWFGERDDER